VTSALEDVGSTRPGCAIVPGAAADPDETGIPAIPDAREARSGSSFLSFLPIEWML
jgi:hypothetical protein